MWVVGGREGRGGVVIPRGGKYWDIFPLVVVILIDPATSLPPSLPPAHTFLRENIIPPVRTMRNKYFQ